MEDGSVNLGSIFGDKVQEEGSMNTLLDGGAPR